MRAVARDASATTRSGALLRCLRDTWRQAAARGVVRSAFVAAAVGFAVDAATKSWAVAALSGRGTVWIWRPWLALRLLRNPGAMLGFASNHPEALTVVTAAIVLGLAYVLACSPGGRLRAFGMALMLSGGAGNLASRLASGSVVDFIQVRGWPGIFNLADVMLRVGVLLFLWAILANRRESRVPPHGDVAPADAGPSGAGSAERS